MTYILYLNVPCPKACYIYNKVPKIDESVCQCQYSTVSVCWCASPLCIVLLRSSSFWF